MQPLMPDGNDCSSDGIKTTHALLVPVRRVLLLQGGYNELLHFLVRLGHQVNWRGLLHDGDVLLERLADHLAETQRRLRTSEGALFHV